MYTLSGDDGDEEEKGNQLSQQKRHLSCQQDTWKQGIFDARISLVKQIEYVNSETALIGCQVLNIRCFS